MKNISGGLKHFPLISDTPTVDHTISSLFFPFFGKFSDLLVITLRFYKIMHLQWVKNESAITMAFMYIVYSYV